MQAAPAAPHFPLRDVSQGRVAVESVPRRAILLSPQCLDKPTSPVLGSFSPVSLLSRLAGLWTARAFELRPLCPALLSVRFDAKSALS